MRYPTTRTRWIPGVAMAVLLASGAAANEPRIRLSVKFILNASGNRPPTGEFNTDAEVQTQIERGNRIYRTMGSEFRHLEYEILDVSGASGFYTADTDDRDAIRNAAIADPATYFWRDNAVNVYVTSASDSARSDFPPDNNIIIICQSIFDTTLAHEVGHTMNLLHTHQSPTDHCSDTLPDNSSWSRDDIATNAYGLVYNLLDSAQREMVDNTWSNLMSYHDGDNRSVITACQADRESNQGYIDRNWMLTKVPTYIRQGAPTVPFDMGSFQYPYPTIQAALDAGEANNRALVLFAGTHDDPANVIDVNTDLVPRRGDAHVQDKKPDYDLPYAVEESKNPAVASAVVRAQTLDRKGDAEGALTALKEAAAAATGRERDVLHLEIAQRLRDAGEYTKAAAYFQLVAAQSEQPALRERCSGKAATMQRRARQAADATQEEVQP